MKLEQKDDSYLLTIYCHATNFYFCFGQIISSKCILYITAEEETIRDVFINRY